jgi:hypothetical protein
MSPIDQKNSHSIEFRREAGRAAPGEFVRNRLLAGSSGAYPAVLCDKILLRFATSKSRGESNCTLIFKNHRRSAPVLSDKKSTLTSKTIINANQDTAMKIADLKNTYSTKFQEALAFLHFLS